MREVAGRLTKRTDLLQTMKYYDVVVSQGLPTSYLWQIENREGFA
jgi:hypothetical protein